jgi:hypothetical protein
MSSMTGRRPVSFLLHCSAHSPDEVLVPVLLFQFFLELRRKRPPKPGVTGNEQVSRPRRRETRSHCGDLRRAGNGQLALNAFCLQPSCVMEVPVGVDRLPDGSALTLAGALETQDER